MNEWLAVVLVLLLVALGVAALAFWIWSLVDAIRVPDDSLYQSGTKVVWVLVIVLVGVIGSIIYLAVGRPEGGAAGAMARWKDRPAPDLPAAAGQIPPPPPPSA